MRPLTEEIFCDLPKLIGERRQVVRAKRIRDDVIRNAVRRADKIAIRADNIDRFAHKFGLSRADYLLVVMEYHAVLLGYLHSIVSERSAEWWVNNHGSALEAYPEVYRMAVSQMNDNLRKLIVHHGSGAASAALH